LILAMTTFRDVQTAVSGWLYFFALVVVGVLAYRGGRLALAALVLLSFAWFGMDTLWEGPILLTLNAHHGVTLADSVGFAGLAFAVWIWLRQRHS
jgi:hypothetical protein